MIKKIVQGFARRKRNISRNIRGDGKRPRIAVFVSNRYAYAQAIDDVKKQTIGSYSSLQLARLKDYKKAKKTIEAKQVGIELAKAILKLKISHVVFDRGGYTYKGRVKALADGLREGGLIV